ncbi:MAG: O-methyltransferase [Elusimicrobia bacterium]|nr:O-methyltransferase [Elusimicrobiota bacterium]
MPKALLEFAAGLMGAEDPVLENIRRKTPEKGLPPISIGPQEGKILETLARSCGARKIIEIGTLAGYSACHLARALSPGGIVHTVEYDARHAEVARENIAGAGLSGKIIVHEGAALDVLPKLESEGPFDVCFIDADKANYHRYLRWAAGNVRSGGLVIGDNAYLFGKLHLNPEQAGEDSAGVPAMREFLKTLADLDLFSSCAMIPTSEGMAVAVRR